VTTSAKDKQQWWHRPWVAPLGVIAVAFVAFSLPRYLSFDRAISLVKSPDHPWHYPLLVGHVTFGSIAMLTAVMQVWPWLRRKHPRVHRVSGRLYVFAGVLPGGLLALSIGAVSPFGPVTAAADVLGAVLWLTFTVNGLRAARAHRYGEHRKWMIRSVALTFSIIANRLWGVLWVIVLTPQLDTTFGGSELALRQSIAALSAWVSFTSVLVLTEWRLQRKPRRRHRPQESLVTIRATASE
jgi:hypothetical protein